MIRQESGVCASGVRRQPFRSRRRLGETKRESDRPECESQMNKSLGILCILQHMICVTMSLSRPVQNCRFRAFRTNVFMPSRGGMKRRLELLLVLLLAIGLPALAQRPGESGHNVHRRPRACELSGT